MHRLEFENAAMEFLLENPVLFLSASPIRYI